MAGAGAEGGVAEFVAELEAEFVGLGTVGFVAPLVFVLNAVSGDRNTLAVEPIPLLHPQLQSPNVIRIVRRKNESDLLVGLKEAGSDAW